MSNNDLVIINNEKISEKNKDFYCDNVDIKSIPENLNKNFNVTLIARKSKTNRARKINIDSAMTASNVIAFLYHIFNSFKRKGACYLIISITPYTFFSYLLLFVFKKKIFVYLRSNGYEEYKAIFGFIGPIIYHFMFKIVTLKSNIITCQSRLFTKRKCEIVYPSELSSNWLENKTEPLLDKPRLLYIGRIKIEKGIFSLIKIFDEIKIDVQLSIVGKKENDNKLKASPKINFLDFQQDVMKLIKIYDDHNIFILPSFTEAHPKVIDESLARLRPVIVFEEISHVIQNKKGIFVSKRDTTSLSETIKKVMENYSSIQKDMLKNKLPTKEEFIKQMSNILNLN